MRVVFLALALAACSPQPPAQQAETEACAAPAELSTIATMYFGRNIGGAFGVDDAEWQTFVDTEITPRFPDGLTITDAQGQWRDSETQAIVREPSKALTVFLSDAAAGRAALDQIADAYKAQFQQQAVALVVETSCLSFE
jgi:hypothetical protein